MKKNYSINLDIELKSRLDAIAKSESLSSSSIINDLVSKYVGSFKPAPEKVILPPEPEMTEEETQAWIKKMEKKNGVKNWQHPSFSDILNVYGIRKEGTISYETASLRP